MDDTTLRAYATHAGEIARRHAASSGGLSHYFDRAFSAGDRILDVGTGAGRDLSLLVCQGYAAFGVEPVAEMRAAALDAHPELRDRIIAATLPGPLPALGDFTGGSGAFDGVLCSAVLQHLEPSTLGEAISSLRDALRPGGRALVSVPSRLDDLGAEGRDELGRLFNDVTPDELRLLFEEVGCRELQRWEADDSLRRCGVRWAVLLFERVPDVVAKTRSEP
jgi:SAM-dependent methyltransferase